MSTQNFILTTHDSDAGLAFLPTLKARFARSYQPKTTALSSLKWLSYFESAAGTLKLCGQSLQKRPGVVQEEMVSGKHS